MPQVPGNTISGAGGYGSYPGNLYSLRYDWLFRSESAHLGTSLVIGTIVRNPYVSVGLGLLHGLGHMFEVTTGNMYEIDFSPGGGGPGQSLTSTATPPSIEEVGRMITGKSGSGKRCPTGMVWSPTHKKCILDITWGTDQYTRKSR